MSSELFLPGDSARPGAVPGAEDCSPRRPLCARSVVSDCDPVDCARQAPLSMGFSRQGRGSGLPCPPPGHLPDAGIEPAPLSLPALVGGFFTTRAPGSAQMAPAPPRHTAHSHTLISLTRYHTHSVTRTVGAHSLSHLCFPLDTPCAQGPALPATVHTLHTQAHTHTHTLTHAHLPSCTLSL